MFSKEISKTISGLTDLTGPNFKYDQDMLLGLVNESQKRMMIWNISNVGVYRNYQKVKKK